MGPKGRIGRCFRDGGCSPIRGIARARDCGIARRPWQPHNLILGEDAEAIRGDSRAAGGELRNGGACAGARGLLADRSQPQHGAAAPHVLDGARWRSHGRLEDCPDRGRFHLVRDRQWPGSLRRRAVRAIRPRERGGPACDVGCSSRPSRQCADDRMALRRCHAAARWPRDPFRREGGISPGHHAPREARHSSRPAASRQRGR